MNRLGVMDRMCFGEVMALVDDYIWSLLTDRLYATETQHVGFRSQVVILRGVIGSGKTTFASFLEMYARSRRYSAIICSADRYFQGPGGFHYDASRLREAHDYCHECFRAAIDGLVNFVIVDNTNIRPDEYEWYVRAAEDGNHRVTIVNFRCETIVAARQLYDRSLRLVSRDIVDRRFFEFRDSRPDPNLSLWVDPIFNTWDDEEIFQITN
jgi:tRNA uridine 5-carbamoylmethylation protein Kti12